MPGARLLIVDDDLFVRKVLNDLLAVDGYLITEASNGAEGVARAAAERPDLVLLDLFMPKMSGLDALARLREVAPASRVLVVSSLDSDALVQQALDAGAAGFVVKPFHALEIREAVKKALSQG